MLRGKLCLLNVFLSTVLLLATGPAMTVRCAETRAVRREDSWYGVYLRGEKIGWSHTTVTPCDSGILVDDTSRLEFTMLGKPETVETKLRSLSGDSLELRWFVFSLSGRDTRFGVCGTAIDTTLYLRVEMGGETRRDTLSFGKAPQVPGTVGLLFAREAVETGKKFRAVVFDPSALAAQELEAEAVGREPLPWRGATVLAWHIRQDLGGVRVDSWLDEKGVVLREESGMGYRLELEDSVNAMGLAAGLRPDIQRLVAVTPDREIPLPRLLVRLELELSGLEPDSLDLDGGPQRAAGAWVEIRMDSPGDTATDSLTREEEDSWLEPSSFILSRHPRVLALLPAVCGAGAEPVEKVRSILAWMQRNITTSPTFSLPNTLEVLESRQGDCNEFAVLFCSLARAAGVPTRVAMGLVYLDGAFYYHAWCECRLGGAWIAVDPVFNQFPADAAHLRLIAGDMDRQVEMLPLIGNLKIKVLDWRTGG